MSARSRKVFRIFGVVIASLTLLTFLTLFFAGRVGDLIGYENAAASSESSE